MYRIVPFKKEHLELMDIREHEKSFLDDNVAQLLENSTVAFTGLYDGRIISAGGLNKINEKTADIWQVPSVYVKTVRLSYAKYIKAWVEEMAEVFELDRMETLCIDDDLHDRWMTFLGFEKEGVKRKFLNNKNYGMWGRLWE